MEVAEPGIELLPFYGPAQTNVETEGHHKNDNINAFLAKRWETGIRSVDMIDWSAQGAAF